MTMALACAVSLGCTITTKDTGDGAGQGGSGQGGNAAQGGSGQGGGAGQGGSGQGGSTDPGAGGGDPGTGGTDPGAGGNESSEHKTKCDRECEKLAAASCDHTPDKDRCEKDCTDEATHVAANTNCTGTFVQYYMCADSATVACDDEGGATIDGCDPQWKAAWTCIDSHAVGLQCDAACVNLVPSAPCGDNDFENQNECQEDCTLKTRVALAYTNCWSEHKAVVACEATHAGECVDFGDEGHEWVIPACDEQYTALDACMSGEGEG